MAATREYLAQRLRQNWLAQHPVEPPITTSSALDDSLTSLNWLHNLNPNPTPPTSPQRVQTPTQVDPNVVLSLLPDHSNYQLKQESAVIRNSTSFTDIVDSTTRPSYEKMDYSTTSVKPPYSYATLICMAIKESSKKKMTLAEIYNWITDNFRHYKIAEPSWQNSIRHNLSLNKCFQKVPRGKNEPGKGGFWRINPEFEDTFVNGMLKKRSREFASPRDTPLSSSPPPLKKMRREWEDTNINSQTKMPRVEIKIEPASNALEDGVDFNWNNILSQDIEIGGMNIKTEDIIDGEQEFANPIMDMSPPPSESSNTNDDMTFEEFFNNTDLDVEQNEPLDFTSGGPFDLSMNGVKTSDWWTEGLNSEQKLGEHESGLHTPTSQSPVKDTDYAHPWAEDQSELEHAIACLEPDFVDLIDVGGMPTPYDE